MDLEQLAREFATASMTINHQLELGVKKYAEDVEAAAKEELGVYQPAIGPFNAWDPLAESTMDDRVNQGYNANEPLLRSGELRDSIQHEVMGLSAIVGTKSQIGYWQEVGTDKIPPRPFIGPAYIRKIDTLLDEVGYCVMRSFRAE
ncbi:hypothetical protein [Martelella alba]|uniref:HK97 gp10 family phage protein n=1 Tax=Martelella alba TaxID=2590451 RepID=A0ABY2SFB0_9HYPH|nr:hypothetical protein [Martelella alba]TKI03580.1 hypothetical protein FCN80_21110 [Martelella alba]